MKKTRFILPAIITLGIFSAANGAYAEETDFSITVQPSVSLSLSSASVNLQITPTQSGVYDSTSFTATASTNNTTGYTLVMTTNSTALVSDTVNVNTNVAPTIPSIAESQEGISAADFAASTDSIILNHWGLAIGNNNFNAIKASQTIKTTDTNVSNDTTTISMASKLNLLTAPGVYSTTLNFQMTANPLPDTLETAYDKAQKQKTTIGGQDYYAIQDMNSSICADVDVIPSTLKVYDNRDNTIYTIGKLADGRCWLLDNLALDLTATNASTSITASNTNADATSLKALFGIEPRDVTEDQTGNLATAGVSAYAGSKSFHAPLINKTNTDVLPTSYEGADDPLASEVISGNWKVGIYYNFCAASAGSYCYGNGTSAGSAVNRPDTAIDAEFDICPSGWRLPTGNNYDAEFRQDGGEYLTLFDAYPTISYEEQQVTRARKALHLPLAGYYYENSAFTQGFYGQYWTSTMLISEKIFILSLETPYAYPQGYADRDLGFSVRCIAK